MAGSSSTIQRRFEVLNELRDRHTELLKQHHAGGCTPKLIEFLHDFIAAGRSLGKLLDRAEERIEAQRILDQWATILLKVTGQEVETSIAEFEGEDLSGKPCPYVGLRPFDEQDHALFYGRNRLREEALEILAKQRFLGILGPSGSGKSSLVLGGILPDLREGDIPSSGSWIYIPPMVPGTAPLESLVNVFQAPPGRLPQDFNASTLLAKPELLAELIHPGASDHPVLVVVDQFEEAFTLCEDPTVREAFIRSLLALVEDQGAAHRLILTMRSDFEPRLALMPELQTRFLETGAVLRALPLTQPELREAIEGPAKAVGLHFHREVVDALLKDVGEEMAGLPLLQFTLRKLWETKRADRITLAQYLSLGGAKEALAKSADDFYLKLVQEERTMAKSILLRMVRLGEGLEVTSSRIRRSSLYELGYDQTKVDDVARKLMEGGLIRVTRATQTVDDQLEVAHEAMVRNWRRFVRWLEEDRAHLLIRRRLDDKAAEWVRLGSSTAGLLDEIQLQEARQWLDTAPAKALGFHPSLPLFVAKSQEFIDAAKREKELAEKKLLEQTRLAEEEQRQRVDAERQLANAKRLRAEARRADEQRLRALAQAKIARRMRRIARLALAQNLVILLAIVSVAVARQGTVFVIAFVILLVVGAGLGVVVLVFALAAIMSPQQPEPSSRSFLQRSLGNVVAGAHGMLGPYTRPGRKL